MRSLLIQANLVPGIGSARLERLTRTFDSARALRGATSATLARAIGVGLPAAERMREAIRTCPWRREVAEAERIGAALVTRVDADYPRRLMETVGPPGVLYVRGDRAALSSRAVAIVGSRTPTAYGRRVARHLGRDLAARGVAVVSGLARGVDGEAHCGALDAASEVGVGAGPTIAVLGSGIDVCYPAAHRALFDAVGRRGLIVTEYPLGTRPHARNFPRRNRIISGLADAVIVVEAALKSGSLITASLAAEQGREVFAVPGSITSDRSAGTHALLRQGAGLLASVDDLFAAMGWEAAGAPGSATAPAVDRASDLDDEQRAVFDCVEAEPVAVDRLRQSTGCEPERLAGILTVLELMDLIRDVGGGRFVRN